MPNYNYILEKLNCARKHIEIIPNGIETSVFAFIKGRDCSHCNYIGFCNRIASEVQGQAQLEKKAEALRR